MPSPPRLAVTENVPEHRSEPADLVVLVHGSLDRSSSFTRVLRRIEDLHTIVYDRRGYHRSREARPLNGTLDGHIDDLLAIIDDRSGPDLPGDPGADRSAVVVGHSFGGAVALGAALHPDGASIRSLAVYEPPMPWLDLWPRRPAGPGGADRPDAALAAERFFRRMVGDAAWDRLPESEKEARRADGPALVAELDAIRITDAPFDVATMPVPVVCGRGALSSDRHRQSVAWLVGHMPHAELMEFDGASHGAHLTHPDAFASMVRRALVLAAETAASRS